MRHADVSIVDRTSFIQDLDVELADGSWVTTPTWPVAELEVGAYDRPVRRVAGARVSVDTFTPAATTSNGDCLAVVLRSTA